MSVTVLATPEPEHAPPRVRLDVTSTSDPEVTVTRTLASSGYRTTVRTTANDRLALRSSGATRTGVLYDYEAPLGRTLRYSTLEDPARTHTPAELHPTRPAWLIRPGQPERSVPVRIREWGERVREVTQGRHDVLGSDTTVVLTDGTRRVADSFLIVRTETLAEADRLNALLSDAAPLLLNVDADRGWTRVAYEFVAVGRVVERRTTDRNGSHPARLWELPYTVTRTPVGNTLTARDYADVLDEARDYAELEDFYADYAALEVG